MDKYCVLKTFTIKETIDKINENCDRVVLVVNNQGKVMGVVSQGDIIRALSSGKSMYSRVEGIVQPSFLYLTERDMEEAVKLFRKKKITLLPVINEQYELQSVITLTDIYDYLGGK